MEASETVSGAYEMKILSLVHVCHNILEFYCQERFLPKLQFLGVFSHDDFLLRFSRSFISFHFILIYLFIFSLTIRLVADRSQVAIGIYPKGSVEKLLKFSLVIYLVPKSMGSVFSLSWK